MNNHWYVSYNVPYWYNGYIFYAKIADLRREVKKVAENAVVEKDVCQLIEEESNGSA